MMNDEDCLRHLCALLVLMMIVTMKPTKGACCIGTSPPVPNNLVLHAVISMLMMVLWRTVIIKIILCC
jgi:hypothetical protein